jgi:hypothetical protein
MSEGAERVREADVPAGAGAGGALSPYRNESSSSSLRMRSDTHILSHVCTRTWMQTSRFVNSTTQPQPDAREQERHKRPSRAAEHVLQQPALDRGPVDRARARVHGLVARDADVREEVREVAHAVDRAHAAQQRPSRPGTRVCARRRRRRRREVLDVLLARGLPEAVS